MKKNTPTKVSFFKKYLHLFALVFAGALYFGVKSLIQTPNISEIGNAQVLDQRAICRSTLTSIVYDRNRVVCDKAAAKTAQYTCLDGSFGKLGDDKSCRSRRSLEAKAKSLCESPHPCPTAVPRPSCVPRPTCLDATPRCMIPETEDMCPASPTPTPIIYHDPRPTPIQ